MRLTLLLLLAMPLAATAQTYTLHLQKRVEGQGTVTIRQSAAVDRVVNGQQQSGVREEEKGKREESRGKREEERGKSTDTHSSLNTQHSTLNTPQKVTGYRVQAYAGGNSRDDRQRAERIAAQIKTRFPDERVYVHFYSPRWICRVGNYRTYEEADSMATQLRKMGISSVTIVRGKISVYNP